MVLQSCEMLMVSWQMGWYTTQRSDTGLVRSQHVPTQPKKNTTKSKEHLMHSKCKTFQTQVFLFYLYSPSMSISTARPSAQIASSRWACEIAFCYPAGSRPGKPRLIRNSTVACDTQEWDLFEDHHP